MGIKLNIFFILLLINNNNNKALSNPIKYKNNNCISKILVSNPYLTELSAHIRLSVCKNDLIDVRYFIRNHPTIIGINLSKSIFDKIIYESLWVNNTLDAMT